LRDDRVPPKGQRYEQKRELEGPSLG
jgi:hypothetical protein